MGVRSTAASEVTNVLKSLTDGGAVESRELLEAILGRNFHRVELEHYVAYVDAYQCARLPSADEVVDSIVWSGHSFEDGARLVFDFEHLDEGVCVYDMGRNFNATAWFYRSVANRYKVAKYEVAGPYGGRVTEFVIFR